MGKRFEFRLNPLDTQQRSNFLNLKSDFQNVPLDLLDFDPDQPRRLIRQETINQLAESIKEVGVLTPILVKEHDNGRFLVVSGERRVRAARIAGLVSIPAVIMRSQDPLKKSLSQLIENIQREDLNPLDRAYGLAFLKTNFNLSIREIAAKVGLSKSQVQRSLQLLALPQSFQELIREGMPESKVLELYRLKVGKLQDQEGADVKNLKDELSKTRSQIRSIKRLSYEETEVENFLKEKFGATTVLDKNKSSGCLKVILYFNTLDELKEKLLKN